MGKKDRKKKPAAPQPGRWPQSLCGLDPSGPQWAAVMRDYKAAVQAMLPRNDAAAARLYGQTPGFLSLRLVGWTMPLIDRCDFLALQIFEEAHPELYADAEAIPARRDDHTDPRDAIRQQDAFHRVVTSRHRDELNAIIEPLRAEREAGGRRFRAPFTPAYCDDMTDRFAREPDAPAVFCPSCAAMGAEPACRAFALMKKDRTIPWKGPEGSRPAHDDSWDELMANVSIVCCTVAQQAIARAATGKAPKFRLPDGTKIVRCTQCNALQTEQRQLQTCARCKSVWYCSKACQKAAWPTHKQSCRAAAAG